MYSATELYIFMGAGVIVGYILGYGYQKLKLIRTYLAIGKLHYEDPWKQIRRRIKR